MYTPKDTDLLNGIKSLRYEVSQMVNNALLLLKRQQIQDTTNNAHLEACLTHVRNLHDFLGRTTRHGKNQQHQSRKTLITKPDFP